MDSKNYDTKSDSLSNNLVSIIILNYNAGKLLLDCVASIYNSNYKNFEIILVDNVSNDNSHKTCKEKFPEVLLIENSENLGYCEGNNVGIRKAHGNFVVILNPDTMVEPNWLDELIDAYQKNGSGFYQPKILTVNDHSMLLSTGNMIQIFGFGYSRSKGYKDTKSYENIEQIDYAAGTCLFTSKTLIEKIGLFESFLFAYHDDLDLCWRASLQGIQSYYVPSSIIYHPIEGYSFKWSPFKFYLMERNRLYCLFTHYSRITILKMLPSLVLVDLAVTSFYAKRGLLFIKIKTSLNILKNFRRISKRYSEIQKSRTITDKEIIGLKETGKERMVSTKAFSDFLTSLKPNDYVVHQDHGIGVFLGLDKKMIDEITREYLKIGYAENDKLYVPIDQADKVAKYIGGEDSRPRLTRLGSAEWNTVTSKVQKETEKVAKELLELYAKRAMAKGHTYDGDTNDQKKFEDTFPYEETPGQIKAIIDVKKDMENPQPMDRLVCGDVGFGKTEVAMRAAFKAVQGKKQVAVIAPITILADQHFKSFSKRMSQFHIRVELLSRFQSPKEQKEIVKKKLISF